MGDVPATFHDAVADAASQIDERLVAVERRVRLQLHGAVEPAQQRLAFSVQIVVYLQWPRIATLHREQGVKPGLDACPVLGRTDECLRAGERVPDCGRQALEQRRGMRVALVDDDEVRFLQLFPIHVGHLLGEAAAWRQSEDPRGARRIDQHAERRNREPVAIDTA